MNSKAKQALHKSWRIGWRSVLWFVLMSQLFIGMLLLFGFLALRYAPLDLSPAIPYILKQVTPEGWDVKVGDATLTYEGRLKLELNNVNATSKEGQSLQLRQFDITMANRGLLIGQVWPKHININGLELKAEYVPEGLKLGEKTLSLQRKKSSKAEKELSEAELKSQPFYAPTLAHFDELAQNLPPKYRQLRRVDIQNSGFQIYDAKRELTWTLQRLNGRLRIYPGELAMNLAGELDRSDRETVLPIQLRSLQTTEMLRLIAETKELDSQMLQGYLAPEISNALSGVGATSLELSFDNQGRMLPWRLNLDWQDVNVMIATAYTFPFPLKSLKAQLRYEPALQRIWLDHVEVSDDNDLVVTAAGRLENHPQTGRYADLVLTSSNAPVAQILYYLPDQFMSKTRNYLLERIGQADVTNFNFQFAGTPEQIQKGCGETCAATMTLDFVNGQMRPLSKLNTLTDFAGTVKLHKNKLYVTTPKVTLGQVAGTNITVMLDHLYEESYGNIHIAGQVQGPLRGSLDELNGLVAEPILPDATGELNGNIKISSPAGGELDVNKIDISAQGAVTNLALSVPGLDGYKMTTPEFKLNIDNWQMHGTAEHALLNENITLDNLSVEENLRKLKAQTKLGALVKIPEDMANQYLQKAGIKIGGDLNSRINFEQHGTDKFSVSTSTKLAGNTVNWPKVNWQKKADVDGMLTVQTDISPTKIVVNKLVLSGAAGSAEATATIDRKNMFDSSLKIAKAKFGRHDFTADYDAHKLTVRGAVLDLAGWKKPSFKSVPKPTEAEGEKNEPELKAEKPKLENLFVDAKLDQLWLGDAPLSNVRLGFDWQDGGVQRVAGTALLEGEVPLSLEFTPNRQLVLTSTRAGRTLRSLGFGESIDEGRLRLVATLPEKGITGTSGMLAIGDYRLRKTPIAAELLASLSLGQLFDGGKGIAFRELHAPFKITKDKLELPAIRLDGDALIITLKGDVNRADGWVDLKGQVVPMVNGLNSFVSNIPLVGSILTGSQEGLVAADVRISGPPGEIKAKSNPLSVLTPGLLKDIFGGL